MRVDSHMLKEMLEGVQIIDIDDPSQAKTDEQMGRVWAAAGAPVLEKILPGQYSDALIRNLLSAKRQAAIEVKASSEGEVDVFFVPLSPQEGWTHLTTPPWRSLYSFTPDGAQESAYDPVQSRLSPSGRPKRLAFADIGQVVVSDLELPPYLVELVAAARKKDRVYARQHRDEILTQTAKDPQYGNVQTNGYSSEGRGLTPQTRKNIQAAVAHHIDCASEGLPINGLEAVLVRSVLFGSLPQGPGHFLVGAVVAGNNSAQLPYAVVRPFTPKGLYQQK